MIRFTQRFTASALVLLIVGVSSAHAQPNTSAIKTSTLTLEANAKAKVSNDEMVVTLAAERDGNDLAALNQGVLQALNAAIDEAKKAKGVQAKMGSLYTGQNWTSQGRPSGWKVRGEVMLTSQNLPELGRLAGELSQKLMLAGIGFRLSDATRIATEKRLLNEAAAAFREKAKDASSALGFGSFVIRDVQLSNSNQGYARPQPMQRMRAEASMASAPAVPTESGESEVMVQFSGSIELK